MADLESIEPSIPHPVKFIARPRDPPPVRDFAIALNISLLAIGSILIGLSYLGSLSDWSGFIHTVSILIFCSILAFVAYFIAVKVLFRISKSQAAMRRMKNAIAGITLTKILDYESQQTFLIGKLSEVVASSNIRERFVEYCHSDHFQATILREIDVFRNSPESFISGVSSNDFGAMLDPIRDICVREGLKVIPSALALFVSEPFISSDRFHQDLLNLISRQLDELSSDVISDQVYAALEAKRIQFAICGNVGGIIFGVFLAILRHVINQ
jgi:hypothetical protein